MNRSKLQQHFGHGIHFCVGARLAQMESRVILEELLKKTESFSLNNDSPVRHVPSIFVRRLAELQLRFKEQSARRISPG